MRKIDKIYVHESDSTFGDVGVVRDWHVNGRGWSDIGYHNVICNGHQHKGDEYESAVIDGEIQQGRDYSRIGAHVRGDNRHSIGICLIGENGEFTDKQMISLEQLIRGLMVQYAVDVDNVLGHYEAKSGKAQGKTCPDIDMAKFRDKLKDN